LAGISDGELARYRNPPGFEGQGGAVPQPDLASAPGPHMSNYPPGRYERVLSIPDEAMLNSVDSQPPVKEH
jgi:hypothetical protein